MLTSTRPDVCARDETADIENVRSSCVLGSVSHMPDVVSKSSAGPSKPATRILDCITAKDVADMHCDTCLDVVRNPAWSSLVMKRLAAKAMPLMSKTTVIGHARQVAATRHKCFSCARPLVLIVPSLVRSEQKASRSLRESANVSRNWAISNGVSSQKSCLEPKRATINK